MTSSASPKEMADVLSATMSLDGAPWRRHRADSRLVSLAADAAQWYTERHGSSLRPEVVRYLREHPLSDGDQAVQRAWLQRATTEDLRSYVPTLAYHFGDRGQLFEWLSSESIREVAAMLAFADRRPGAGDLRILDIAAGSAALLQTMGAYAERLGYRPMLRGTEIQDQVAVLATAALTLSGLDSAIECANALLDDPFVDESFDLAVAQPPFGLSWQSSAAGVRERHAGGWYGFGVPPTSDATWLFASRLVEKLRPADAGGGRAVTFAAGSPLWMSSGAEIRERVLDEDLLEFVVALPAGLTQASVPIFALTFNNNKPERRRGRVQLIDLRGSSETSRLREAPRRLRPSAYDALRQAVSSIKDGLITRTVPTSRFLKDSYELSRPIQADRTTPSWHLKVARDSSCEAEVERRYGPVPVEARPSRRGVCEIEIATSFDAEAARVDRWLKQVSWPATRLSALLLDSPVVASAESVDEDIVLLPISPNHIASLPASDAGEANIRRLALRVDHEVVMPEFLVGWLNSPYGNEARVRAFGTASTGSVIKTVATKPKALLRFCDELIVPLPPLAVQRDLASVDVRLAAAAALVASLRRDSWDDPAQAGEANRLVEPLFDRSLVSWTNDLPYPVASALWAFEAQRNNPDPAHRQIHLVWEAYAAFFATVLLSALKQDPVLAEQELPVLRQALRAAHLDMNRATVGGWKVIVERLARRFRDRLSADEDERSAVIDTFGGAPRTAVERLLDPRIVELISDANAKRNAWSGHVGAVGAAELAGRVTYLVDRLEELRQIVGGAWRELPCVRAGSARRRQGVTIQSVELAIGPNAPFRQAEFEVGDLMEEGELYFCADGARQPLPLLHLVVLRSAPGSAQYTCYFYNRRERDQVRLVAYQLADRSEVMESAADFTFAIAGLVEQ